MAPSPPRSTLLPVAVAVALVLGGCRGGSPDTGAPATSVGPAPSAGPSLPTTTTAAAAATTTTAAGRPSGSTTSTRPPAPVTTAGNGPTARVVLKPGALSDVAFGAPRAEALGALSGLIGEAQPGDPASPCPLGLASARWDVPGLIAYFRDDTFVGWYAPPTRKVALLTAEGVPVNGTVGQFRSAYGDRFSWSEGSSLGDEFTVAGPGDSGIAGVAGGRADASRVETLWSGQTCIAR